MPYLILLQFTPPSGTNIFVSTLLSNTLSLSQACKYVDIMRIKPREIGCSDLLWAQLIQDRVKIWVLFY
jgi:hypothetical protein